MRFLQDLSRGLGVQGVCFAWYHHSHCGLYCNEISDKLAKREAVKNVSEISYSNLLLSSHEISSRLEKTVFKNFKKRS